MKTCSKCGEEKELEEFVKHNKLPDGHTRICKVCRKKYLDAYNRENREKLKEAKRIYYLENKETHNAKAKIYYKNNAEEIKLKVKKYASENRDKIKISRKVYNQKNKKELNIKKKLYWKKKPELRRSILKRCLNKNPLNRIKNNLRNRVYHAMMANSWKKSKRTEEILGIDFLGARAHIESLFKPGMTWENYGHGDDKWHIDHRMPLSIAQTKEELEKLCHYTNLQPLWQIENLEKHDKIMCNPCTYHWARSKSWTDIPEGPMCNPTVYQGFK